MISSNDDDSNSATSELLRKIKEKIDNHERFFSVEIFPPKTFNGATSLFGIMCRLNELEDTKPLFADITWKPSKEPMSDKCLEPTTLLIAASARQVNNFNTIIHIPYFGTTRTQVFEHLMRAKEFGVCGIRAQRPAPGITYENPVHEDGFSSIEDLIIFIKQEFGNDFAIAVTGYPSQRCDWYDSDLALLKREVDAGADFITTQLFFEVETFFKFERDCRNIGIDIPIIPGILPIQNLQTVRNLRKMNFAVKVPNEILEVLKSGKEDLEAIQAFGIQHATKMCQELFASGKVQGIHLYTLNIEKPVMSILENLKISKEPELNKLPWQLSDVRSGEDVRPIFWASRPRSYLIRTSNWEDMPNGRWGNSSSASFGDLKDYHLFLTGTSRKDSELLSMWGRELNSEQDVFDIFVCYLTGRDNKQGFKVTELPWSDGELAPETIPLVEKLVHANQNGILTINSQPSLNAVPSEDPNHGWGKPGGYVFQKAYLEFFAREEIALELYHQLKDGTRINFHLVNSSGESDFTNANMYSPNAVTWGVFPGSEILQPTVVDPIAFHYWKDEAFGLWKQQWGRLYPEGSRSRDIIDSIYDSYYLVNLVDNDYVGGNSLFDILDGVIKKVQS
ncbi:predicted protein [Nematostella vectensis]|uniref:MTHFR SAM-binding regulatory domain-containing protein n=1 Tax=Nematostella vectensis TaxID=45351 RepID=A7S5W8_NEMVE|nr:predicted protein [Nematostella vectensis]|eukprot:XP_001632898.1 predicted protein [Nematostella vectensis]